MSPEIKKSLNWRDGDYIITVFYQGGHSVKAIIGNSSENRIREENIPLREMPLKSSETISFSKLAHLCLKHAIEKSD